MKIIRNESGQTLVVVAIFMSIAALGFLALAVDLGSLFREKRMAQNAADAAALAAAAELAAGHPSNEQGAANAMAKLNGFDTTLANNAAVVTLQEPNTGDFTGSGYVQATVSQPIRGVFLGAFNSKFATMSVSAKATAGGKSSQTCVCLSGTSGQNLNMSNGSTLSASQCGIVADSNSSNAISISGGATLQALSLGTVSSSWDNSSNVYGGGGISGSTTIVQGISSTCNPVVPAEPAYSGCAADPGGSYGTFTFGPASPGSAICYQALTVGGNGSTCTLKPGIYVITTGALHFQAGANGHSNLGGDGVFFYLTGTASLQIDNGANVNLVAGGSTDSNGVAASSLGVYDGIAIAQDVNDTSDMSIQGGASTFISGSLYAPAAAMTLGNGSSATINSGIFAKSLTMNGGGTLNAVAATNEGSLSIGFAKLVQ